MYMCITVCEMCEYHTVTGRMSMMVSVSSSMQYTVFCKLGWPFRAVNLILSTYIFFSVFYVIFIFVSIFAG